MLVLRLLRGAVRSRAWCSPVTLYSTGAAIPGVLQAQQGVCHFVDLFLLFTAVAVLLALLTVTPDNSHSSQNNNDNRLLEAMENPFKEPPKKCILCDVPIDYKNVQLLSQFVSPHTGRIYGRRVTGLCGKKQKAIAKAIKRAHIMGFMPVTYKDPEFLKDPKICNI